MTTIGNEMEPRVQKCTTRNETEMNWDYLKLFLAVARTGSISGAAKHLEVQHSTVSRRIRQLESRLGSRLLERKPKGYELTPAGEHVKKAAEHIEHEILGIDGTLPAKDTSLSGTLRVTAINNMASSVLMPIFADFSKQHPGIELHIIVSNNNASLAEREADIAIRLTNTPTDTLIGKKLVTVASTIYGNRHYLEELAKTASSPQWLGVECCVFHKTWTRQCSEQTSYRFYSDDTLLTQSAIRAGLGISFLPCFMGDSDPLLKRYCEPDPSHDLGLWLLLHPDLKRTARVLAFREHLSKSINTQKNLFEGRLEQVP